MNLAQTFNFRYLTDPERIKRILPPLLEPDDEPIVFAFYLLYTKEDECRDVYFDNRYTESGLAVAAKYRGHRCAFHVGMPLNQDWGRTQGRDSFSYHKKDGGITFDASGNTISASLFRRGNVIHRAETVVTDEIAHPSEWSHEYGYGLLMYRFRPHPDWRRGPIGEQNVELWRLGGHNDGYPTEMMEGEGLPRVCDVSRTHFEFVDKTALDPFCEFPCHEIVAATFTDRSYEGKAELEPYPSRPGGAEIGVGGARAVYLEDVDKKAFEPWALHGYDRPINKGKVWTPAGWPESNSAFTVNDEELDALRSRDRIELDPVELVDVRLEIDPQIHAKTLPPGCSPGNEAMLRVLAMRVEASDLSPQPFNELFLMSQFELDGQVAYYPIADIVGWHGDVLFGRETYGLPSKMGDVDIEIDDDEVQIRGTRMGREFCRLQAALTTTASVPDDEEMTVVGMNGRPFRPGHPMVADLVKQPWQIAHKGSRRVASGSVTIELPDAPGKGVIGRPDPWFEFQSCEVRELTLSRVAIGRLPGEIIGEVPKFLPYFVERYDGIAGRDTPKMMAEGSRATFLTGK